MNVKYTVIFEQAPSNWAAYVLDLPGCMTTGPTLEDTKANIREAMELYIEDCREAGDPVPTEAGKELVEVEAARCAGSFQMRG